jgi:hypothetical protein
MFSSTVIQSIFTRAVLLAGMALVMGACETAPVLPPGTQCEITGTHTAFYKYGPAQSFGADEVIPHGTLVTLLERGFGFSRVMRPNGMTGYVATEELQPLAPEQPKKAPPRVASNRKADRDSHRTFDGPIKRSNVKPTPEDPLFDINDVPLPTKEPPKPAAKATPQPPQS